MTAHLEVATTFEEVERLRRLWDRVPWEREEAEYELFVARARARTGVIAPFAAFLTRDAEPVAGVAARLEERRLETAVGYRVVVAPKVRMLQLADGGLVAPDFGARAALVGALRAAFRDPGADAIAVPPLAVGSELERALSSLGSQQRFIAPWTRRRLVLPATFDDFLASRSANTRWRIRRDARRLADAFGEELTTEVLATPVDLDRIARDVDAVAGRTYQRALGAGFANTPEQRALLDVGLERGWVRTYLLYHAGNPIAYWLCTLYRGTLLVRWTGFDDAYADYRVGYHLLARVVEAACADPEIAILDFGPGDAAYKLQFGSEASEERNLVVYAPTLRARRIELERTAVLGGARLVRRTLDAVGATDRLRAGWRRALRQNQRG